MDPRFIAWLIETYPEVKKYIDDLLSGRQELTAESLGKALLRAGVTRNRFLKGYAMYRGVKPVINAIFPKAAPVVSKTAATVSKTVAKVANKAVTKGIDLVGKGAEKVGQKIVNKIAKNTAAKAKSSRLPFLYQLAGTATTGLTIIPIDYQQVIEQTQILDSSFSYAREKGVTLKDAMQELGVKGRPGYLTIQSK